MPDSWEVSRIIVLGLRAEENNPQLYEGFEWLAERAGQFWEERESHPPEWRPIDGRAPTAGDEAVYEAFNRIWSTNRDRVSREFVDDLAQRAPDFETFSSIVRLGSEEYIKFDRVFCAY